MDKLEPCPFCGNPKVELTEYDISGEKHIECDDCGVCVCFDVGLSRDEVTELWNRQPRPVSDSSAGGGGIDG